MQLSEPDKGQPAVITGAVLQEACGQRQVQMLTNQNGQVPLERCLHAGAEKRIQTIQS